MQPDAKTFNKRFPAFDAMSKADLVTFIENLTTNSIDAGTTIISRGGQNDSLRLIWEGEVAVTLEADGHARELGKFGPGRWFGEMGLIDPAPAAAAVTAQTDCVLLELSQSDFSALRRSRPSVTSSLLQLISRELAQRLRVTVHHLSGDTPAATAPSHEKERWFVELGRRISGLSSRVQA